MYNFFSVVTQGNVLIAYIRVFLEIYPLGEMLKFGQSDVVRLVLWFFVVQYTPTPLAYFHHTASC